MNNENARIQWDTRNVDRDRPGNHTDRVEPGQRDDVDDHLALETNE